MGFDGLNFFYIFYFYLRNLGLENISNSEKSVKSEKQIKVSSSFIEIYYLCCEISALKSTGQPEKFLGAFKQFYIPYILSPCQKHIYFI